MKTEDAAVKKRVDERKDIGLIICLMGAHESSAAEAGCWTRNNLAWNNAGNQVAIAAKGGTEAVVRATGEHGRAGVQACDALNNLAAANAENQVAIAAKGGIEAIVRGMGAHGPSAGVQEAGCRALSDLAFNDENEVAIAARGGIEAIVRGMVAHGSSAGVQEAGCAALNNLATMTLGNILWWEPGPLQRSGKLARFLS
ncbi:hypothetical protein T484DRAFT_1826660 [Baffinella frigidus]|nr:hypothetical protein T484DRAFT_1826660 [Cryptophyta sp. CCMP2293]